MEIASLRAKIVIEKHVTTVDDIGNHISSWEEYYACRAYVNLTSGSDYGISPETIEQGTMTFIVRYARKLSHLNTKEYRIRFGDELFNIQLVDDVQKRHEKIRIIAEKEPRKHEQES